MGFVFTETMLEGRDDLLVGGETSLIGSLKDMLEGFLFSSTTETVVGVSIVLLVQESSYR